MVGVYNAADFIGETVAAILSQTHPAHEVIVVDDGSTDGTRQVLEAFSDRVRVVAQRNGGCPAAFNRGFREARGEYVAMCGADDVWAPERLERQVATLRSHPEVDVAFGGAWNFGLVEYPWPAPPAGGVLDGQGLLKTLYRENIVCASSVLLRRSLYQRIGPFVESAAGERFACDDYEYWLRALAAGAVFHYDPQLHVHYRRHAANATNDHGWIYRSQTLTHRWYADAVNDRALVRSSLAHDLRLLARAEVDGGDRAGARALFLRSLRERPNARALGFVLVLTLPGAGARRAVDVWTAIKDRAHRCRASFAPRRGARRETPAPPAELQTGGAP